MNKVDKFYEVKNLLQCPICGKKIRFHAGGLVCKKEHRFDISAKGYVNFLQSSKPLKGYDRDFFESRHRFFRDCYYDHISDAVISAALGHSPLEVVMDAGCGEGFYAARLCDQVDAQILAFDIATEAIKVAARNPAPVKWLASDITNIPVKDGMVDCILDVFTPANYGEFIRVLKEDGIVIKVVPGEHHLQELREAAKNQIRNREYSNDDVLEYFADHFEVVSSELASKTMPIEGDALADLIRMTPLLFDVDKTAVDTSRIREITVEGQVLVGRKK